MAKEIRLWSVKDDSIEPISKEDIIESEKRLERWIRSDSSILGEDIILIGEQVITESGIIDFLGIDRNGDTVIIELKRENLPREVIAQSIDYASNIATWEVDKLNDICQSFTKKDINEVLFEHFEEEMDISFNQNQRIIVVGTSVDDVTERMIDWLATFGIDINFVLIKYIKTSTGELLARTMIISKEIEPPVKKLTPTKIEYRDFYTATLDGIRKEFGITRKAPADSWCSLGGLNISNVHLEWAFHRGWFEVGLHFEALEEKNKALYEYFLHQKDELEKAMGETLIFEHPWGKKWARIYAKKEYTQINDNELKKWAIETMLTFFRIFKPKLQKIRSQFDI